MCQMADTFKKESIARSKNRTGSTEDRILIDRILGSKIHPKRYGAPTSPAPGICTLNNKEYLDIFLVIIE